MKTVELELYKFEELPEDVQAKLIEKNYDINVDDHYWYEYVFEDAKEIGSLMGIDIKDIYFSLHVQGSGATFNGSYYYQKGSVKKVTSHAPLDEELHRIVKSLALLQRKFFYGLYATIEHSGHYNHERCNTITVDHHDSYHYDSDNMNEVEDELTELLRDYMVWIYNRLQKEYDYYTSEEQIKDQLICMEYDYTKNGRIF
jgi:hypothetical protein